MRSPPVLASSPTASARPPPLRISSRAGPASSATAPPSWLTARISRPTARASWARKFADGLEKGKGQIPTYSSAARDRLSTVVSTPVTTPKVDTVFSDIATTTYLAVIALWIGALASYLVLRAVTARVLSSRKASWRLALDGLAPGAAIVAIQAVALTVVLQLLLHLGPGQVVALLGFALLAGCAFAAVNQALVAWFGGVGRFISVALVVVAAAGAITSAVPA